MIPTNSTTALYIDSYRNIKTYMIIYMGFMLSEIFWMQHTQQSSNIVFFHVYVMD